MKKTKNSVKERQRKLAEKQKAAKAAFLKRKKRAQECKERQLQNERQAPKPGPIVKKSFGAKTVWPDGSIEKAIEDSEKARKEAIAALRASNFELGDMIL